MGEGAAELGSSWPDAPRSPGGALPWGAWAPGSWLLAPGPAPEDTAGPPGEAARCESRDCSVPYKLMGT